MKKLIIIFVVVLACGCTDKIELKGSDELIVTELSLAVIRILKAMEQSDGYSVKENLTALVLKMLAESE